MTAAQWTEDAVHDVVEQLLTAQLSGATSVAPSDNFFRVGGDSLGMIRLISELDSHGLPLTARDFVDRPTLQGIVASVMRGLSRAESGEGR
jgi:aryl carrier-like protein